MPEATVQEGLAEAQGQAEAPNADAFDAAVQKDMASSEQAPAAPTAEQPNGEKVEVPAEVLPDVGELPNDLKERDKHWQRAFTKKTTDYSRQVKDLRAEVEQAKALNAQFQQVLNNPAVYSTVAEVFNLPGAKKGNGTKPSKLAALDPEAREILDEVRMMAKEEAKQELMQEFGPMLKKVSVLDEKSQEAEDQRQIETLEKNGYPVDDEIRDKMDSLADKYPGISAIEAYRIASFDKVEEIGKNKKLAELSKAHSASVQKPGFSSAGRDPVSDKGKSLEQMYMEEIRKQRS